MARAYMYYVYGAHRQSVDTQFRRGKEKDSPIDFHRVSKFCMHIQRGANALYKYMFRPSLSLITSL